MLFHHGVFIEKRYPVAPSWSIYRIEILCCSLMEYLYNRDTMLFDRGVFNIIEIPRSFNMEYLYNRATMLLRYGVFIKRDTMCTE